MIEAHATVVSVEDSHTVWVRVVRNTACGTCAQTTHCGTSLLSQITAMQPPIRVVSAIPVLPGDIVIIGLTEGTLLRGSVMVYLLPLLLLLTSALCAQAILHSIFRSIGEGPVILAGGIGLALGFVIARGYTRRWSHDPRCQLVVLRHIHTVGHTFSPAITL